MFFLVSLNFPVVGFGSIAPSLIITSSLIKLCLLSVCVCVCVCVYASGGQFGLILPMLVTVVVHAVLIWWLNTHLDYQIIILF